MPPYPTVHLAPITHYYPGLSVRLHCEFEGRPSPGVQWYRNADRLSMKNTPRGVRVVKDGPGGVGIVLIDGMSVAEITGGMYQCRAENNAGLAEMSSWVHVQLTG